MTIRTLCTLLAALGVLAAPAVASAHGGHGTTEPSSALHYLAEPLHLFGLLAVFAAVGLLVLRRRRARDRSR